MIHTNSKLEDILYSIVEELSKDNLPIVFKGALALKELLYLNNPNIKIERNTVDIDANWIEKYDKNLIEKSLNKAIKRVNNKYTIQLVREPNEMRSMGFKVLDENKSVITKIDIDIKDNPFYVVCKIKDIDIKFSNLNRIMADKLLCISKEHVFRRVKDILDIYMIIIDNEIKYKEVMQVLDYEHRKLGDFSTMIDNKQKIKEAYDKLVGIKNKPDFDIVWNKVVDYLNDNNYM